MTLRIADFGIPASVDWEIRVKIFVMLIFVVCSIHLQFFLIVDGLQYGQAPGAFLAFSLLPGIGRTKYRWL